MGTIIHVVVFSMHYARPHQLRVAGRLFKPEIRLRAILQSALVPNARTNQMSVEIALVLDCVSCPPGEHVVLF